MNAPRRDTRSQEYTARLAKTARWKQWLHVQAPYRWNLRRLEPGWVADIGCGVGRTLQHVDGHGIGIDHNPHSVALARQRGCLAFTPEDFETSEYARVRSFDSLLFAHVLEHMRLDEARELVDQYLPYLRPSGKTILITPQQAGYRSDPTHVEFMDFVKLSKLLADCGLSPVKAYSFPLPHLAGRLFVYNEFVVVGRKS